MMPCSFTPLTRKMVTGVLFFRTWFKNTSWTFCDFSGVMGIPPSLLGVERAGSYQINKYSNNAAEFPIGRWARGDKSQALDIAKQGRAIGKHQAWPASVGLLLRHPAFEKHRNAAGIVGAFHVNTGVAYEPNRIARANAARLQR